MTSSTVVICDVTSPGPVPAFPDNFRLFTEYKVLTDYSQPGQAKVMVDMDEFFSQVRVIG